MLFNNERREKVILMIYELVDYINSFDNDLEKIVSMDAVVMTLISTFAESKNETPIETTNRLLEQFKAIKED